ncbi:hypothetical protein BC834DRAFT_967315 [Gloeopeniophorella convolvens]|nr:hypothetical protein BC834DRAFT_967315 [Gloeopeniophorella convolvens]
MDVNSSTPKKIRYSDPSGAIFSIYLERAQRADKEKADDWKRSANGIFLFTGLFSATVATFLVESFKTLKPDPRDTTNALLAQISLQFSQNSGDTRFFTASLVDLDERFQPSTSAVAVNSIWFLSLVLSLTCALGAVLLEQWTLWYIHVTQRDRAPYINARIRGYLAEGIRKHRMPLVADALPTLLLISIFLFFAGLVIYTFDTNHTVGYVTLLAVAFAWLAYTALTFMPVVYSDSPFRTPQSSLFWFIFLHRKIISFIARSEGRSQVSRGIFRDLQSLFSVDDVTETIISMTEKASEEESLDIYTKALKWTGDLLDEDHNLEDFAAGLPGLFSSEALKPKECVKLLIGLPGPKELSKGHSLAWSIMELARRAGSAPLSDERRDTRVEVCMRALYYIPGAVHEMLAKFAAREYNCLEILPLINPAKSMSLATRLIDVNDADHAGGTPWEVQFSAVCVTAIIAAIVITPPKPLATGLFTGSSHIGDDASVPDAISKRISVQLDTQRPNSGGAEETGATEGRNISTTAEVKPVRGRPSSPLMDSARLGNLTAFLREILPYLATLSAEEQDLKGAKAAAKSIWLERYSLEYSESQFNKPLGDRDSPYYFLSLKYDLVKLTLEILTRDPFIQAKDEQQDAFRVVIRDFIAAADGTGQPALGGVNYIDMALDEVNRTTQDPYCFPRTARVARRVPPPVEPRDDAQGPSADHRRRLAHSEPDGDSHTPEGSTQLVPNSALDPSRRPASELFGASGSQGQDHRGPFDA